MNLYTVLLAVLVVVVAAFLIIIRDAITIDSGKAQAALAAFGGKVAGLFRKAPK